MTLQRIANPTVEPVSLAEAKMHLRVTGCDEDALIEAMIAAARESAEHRTGRALIAQTWRMASDSFPATLPFVRFPAPSISSVKYRDSAGVLQTAPPADYIGDLWTNPISIRPASGVSWPVTTWPSSAVEVTIRSGYAVPVTVDSGADTITVPDWETLAVSYSVRFSNVGGALPSPLRQNTNYYIGTVVSPGVYTLADTPGGTTIDLTDAGTGTTLLGEVPAAIRAWILCAVGTMFANRENVAVDRSIAVVPMPFIDGLLDPYVVYSV